MLLRHKTLRALLDVQRELLEVHKQLLALQADSDVKPVPAAAEAGSVLGPEARSLVKEWLTTLVSIIGILLAAVLAGLGILHGALPGFSWARLAADLTGGTAAAALVLGIYLALRALGFLITGTRSIEGAWSAGAQTEDDRSHADGLFVRAALDAQRAQWCLITGVGGIVLFAASALTALNIEKAHSGKSSSTAAIICWR